MMTALVIPSTVTNLTTIMVAERIFGQVTHADSGALLPPGAVGRLTFERPQRVSGGDRPTVDVGRGQIGSGGVRRGQHNSVPLHCGAQFSGPSIWRICADTVWA